MALRELKPWQSVLAKIGVRYRYTFQAQGSTAAVTSATVAEARRVLAMRSQLYVVDVRGLAGGILQADMEARAVRPLIALQGEFVDAGTPTRTFRAVRVDEMIDVPATTLAQRAIAAVAAPVREAGAAVAAAGGPGAVVGDQLGALISGIVNPLIIPAIIGFAAYTLIIRKVG